MFKMYFKILCFFILIHVSQQFYLSNLPKEEDLGLDTTEQPKLINSTEAYQQRTVEDYEDNQALDNKRVIEICKVIMIFTCCVLAIVLICFLICILRNSDMLVSTSTQSQENLNLNNVFCPTSDENSNNTLDSNNFLINLPFEKPPSYLDVLKEIGQPPPVYQTNLFNNNPQSNIVNLSSSVQNRTSQDELILDCNRWLEQSNNERSSLESRLLESRLNEENREKLRRLSRDSERCHLPVILLRSHSSPVIRNSLLLRGQHLINANNESLINSLTSNPCSSHLSNIIELVNQCINQNQADLISSTCNSSSQTDHSSEH